MDVQSAAAFTRALNEYGLAVRSSYTQSPLTDLELGIPERATVSLGKSATEKTLVYLPMMTMTGISHNALVSSSRNSLVHSDGDGDLLVLGDRINERSADMFRRNGVNYLDEAGNAFVTFEGVRIDVRGRRPEGPSSARGSSALGKGEVSGVTNLFSAKRSQVICVLLAWPELLNVPLRYAAEAAGVSLGLVQSTINELQIAGFVHAGNAGKELRRRSSLVDLWAAAFPSGLGSPKRTRAYAGDIGTFEVPPGVAVSLSGEAALAGKIRPETLTVYVDDSSLRALVAHNRWRTDRAPNIFARNRFWEGPEPLSPGIHHAPGPLVYADLLASGDGRQAEVAREYRERDDRLR